MGGEEISSFSDNFLTNLQSGFALGKKIICTHFSILVVAKEQVDYYSYVAKL